MDERDIFLPYFFLSKITSNLVTVQSSGDYVHSIS